MCCFRSCFFHLRVFGFNCCRHNVHVSYLVQDLGHACFPFFNALHILFDCCCRLYWLVSTICVVSVRDVVPLVNASSWSFFRHQEVMSTARKLVRSYFRVCLFFFRFILFNRHLWCMTWHLLLPSGSRCIVHAFRFKAPRPPMIHAHRLSYWCDFFLLLTRLISSRCGYNPHTVFMIFCRVMFVRKYDHSRITTSRHFYSWVYTSIENTVHVFFLDNGLCPLLYFC